MGSDEDRNIKEKIRHIIVEKRRYREMGYSAASMAAELGVTPARLSGILRDNFGENYSSLINRYRVKEAKKYLLDRNKVSYTVDDIAYSVGFSNRQSFFSAFKRFVGTTPDKWRREEVNKCL